MISLAVRLLLTTATLLSAQPLRFKTGPAASAVTAEPGKSLRPGREHRIVQFATVPDATQLEGLEARGVRLLQYVPDHGLLVTAPAGLDLFEVGLRASTRLTPDHKLSPLLAATEAPSVLVVEFFPDVDEGDARLILNREGLRIREHPDLLPGHLLVEATPEQASALAGWDEVAYVFPGSDDLERGEPVRACAGAITDLGPVGHYISKVGEGWDGPGRNPAQLAYGFQSLTQKQPAAEVRAEILRAFQEWSRYVQVSFQEGGTPLSARHLNILFASGPHGDSYAFDGRGRILAHTFFPSPPNPEPIAGDLHFDEDEDWRIGLDTDIYSVVLHELGHALGLGHSDRPGAVMYGYYKLATALTAEDITAIRELYAAREPNQTPEAPAPPKPPADPPKPPATPPPAPPPPPPAADRTPPSITITSPASTSILSSAATITVRGRASDNVGVTQVVWTSNTGGNGVAKGTAEWVAESIPLLRGTNYIIVRAYDAAGNAGWRSVVVTRW